MSIGTLFTLLIPPAVYVWMATDHQANAELAADQGNRGFDPERQEVNDWISPG